MALYWRAGPLREVLHSSSSGGRSEWRHLAAGGRADGRHAGELRAYRRHGGGTARVAGRLACGADRVVT